MYIYCGNAGAIYEGLTQFASIIIILAGSSAIPLLSLICVQSSRTRDTGNRTAGEYHKAQASLHSHTYNGNMEY